MADEMEQIKVHVDDGTKRGHDRMMTRKDAEKFMMLNPGAAIMDDEAPAEEEASEEDDGAKAKAVKPAANKAQKAPEKK